MYKCTKRFNENSDNDDDNECAREEIVGYFSTRAKAEAFQREGPQYSMDSSYGYFRVNLYRYRYRRRDSEHMASCSK
jgi:hypothetical protein